MKFCISFLLHYIGFLYSAFLGCHTTFGKWQVYEKKITIVSKLFAASKYYYSPLKCAAIPSCLLWSYSLREYDRKIKEAVSYWCPHLVQVAHVGENKGYPSVYLGYWEAVKHLLSLSDLHLYWHPFCLYLYQIFILLTPFYLSSSFQLYPQIGWSVKGVLYWSVLKLVFARWY